MGKQRGVGDRAADGWQVRRPGAPTCGVQPQRYCRPGNPKALRRVHSCDVQEQHDSGVQPELSAMNTACSQRQCNPLRSLPEGNPYAMMGIIVLLSPASLKLTRDW